VAKYTPSDLVSKEYILISCNVDLVESYKVTTVTDYFSPQLNCKPILDNLEFELLLNLGPSSKRIDFSDVNLTVVSNLVREAWNGQFRGNNATDAIYWEVFGDLFLFIETKEWTGNLTVAFPGFLNQTLCETRARAYLSGCGLDKSTYLNINAYETTEISDGCPDVEDGFLLLTTSECRRLDRTASNITMSLTQCRAENRYGAARLTFEPDNESYLVNITETVDLSLKSHPNIGRYLAPLAVSSQSRYDRFDAVCEDCTNYLVAVNYTFPLPQETWLDTQSLRLAIEASYPPIATQMFRLIYFKPSNTTVPGEITGLSSRLSVKGLPCLLVASILFLVALSCIGILFSHPHRQLPRDPTTLAGTSVILASYTQIARDIHKYCGEDRNLEQTRHWRPWGTTFVSKMATLGVICLLVASLEITAALSDRNGGLLYVESETWTFYCWSVFPSFILFLASLLIAQAELSFRMLQPFVMMTRGGHHVIDAFFNDYIYGHLPIRLWRSFSRCQFALTLITIAASITPLLTIVASNLLNLSPEPSSYQDFSLLQHDGFDTSMFYNWTTGRPGVWTTGDSDYNFVNVLKLANFTTDRFVIPRISIPDSTLQALSNHSLVVHLPAAQGNLNCTFLDDEDVVCSNTDYRLPESGDLVPCNKWNFTIPSNFITRPKLDNRLWPQHECDLQRTACLMNSNQRQEMESSFLNGTAVDLMDIYMQRTTYIGDIIKSYGLIPTTGCPPMLRYGLDNLGDCNSSRMSIAVCTPFVDIIDVDVTFGLPNFKIESVIPRLKSKDDDSGQILNISSLSDLLIHMSEILNIDTTNSDLHRSRQDGVLFNLENFFMAMNSSEYPDPVNLQDIASNDSTSRIKIRNALERQWDRAMTLLINNHFRSSDYNPPAMVNGTLLDYNRRKLIQNKLSTRILQGLLLVIFIMLTIAFFTNRRMDSILEYPPTSIGAAANLLMKVNILGRFEQDGSLSGGLIQPGIERMTDEELKRIIFNNKKICRLETCTVVVRL
jgi:hypothetical protein